MELIVRSYGFSLRVMKLQAGSTAPVLPAARRLGSNRTCLRALAAGARGSPSGESPQRSSQAGKDLGVTTEPSQLAKRPAVSASISCVLAR